jgi:hypothetical protein
MVVTVLVYWKACQVRDKINFTSKESLVIEEGKRRLKGMLLMWLLAGRFRRSS